MKILGIKLSHDGAIALIDDNKLVFSLESEKFNNNKRHSNWHLDIPEIQGILNSYYINMKDIDRIVIDGYREDNLFHNGNKLVIETAGYGYFITEENILQGQQYFNQDLEMTYTSYLHVSGHVFGAYCSSPFANLLQNSFILVWDGSMPPQLFYYNCVENSIRNLGILFPLIGILYSMFSVNFEPYMDYKFSDNSLAGKVMAYTSLGEVNSLLLKSFTEIDLNYNSEELNALSLFDRTRNVCNALVAEAKSLNLDSKNIFATFQYWIEQLLLKTLSEKLDETGFIYGTENLCFAGGSALNIKWNSVIRHSNLFKEMWVPPFANDSGSALGVACCEMINAIGIKNLDWSVYSGPYVRKVQNKDFESVEFSIPELAKLLTVIDEPVVMINGPAEIGPRALGNRSLLSSAEKTSSKDALNKLKDRESYRPVAPICLEEDARDVFEPGTRDPYMLFNHIVKENWLGKVPAIVHTDQSSRLQTVGPSDNPVIYELLIEYKKITGIPLLCNTSANLNGSGFFPDVDSAIKWGKSNFIWSEGRLYFSGQKEIEVIRFCQSFT